MFKAVLKYLVLAFFMNLELKESGNREEKKIKGVLYNLMDNLKEYFT